MPMSLHSPKKQEDVALKAHVASVCFKCFRCMLQVFHTNVAKVDWGCCNGCIRTLQVSVPNVSFVFSDVCCKCVLSRCCICVHTYVVSVLSGYYVYLQWFSSVFRCFFFKCFRSMF
jgi:hypothetical protein